MAYIAGTPIMYSSAWWGHTNHEHVVPTSCVHLRGCCLRTSKAVTSVMSACVATPRRMPPMPEKNSRCRTCGRAEASEAAMAAIEIAIPKSPQLTAYHWPEGTQTLRSAFRDASASAVGRTETSMRISYLPPRPRHAPRRAQIPLVLSVAMIKTQVENVLFCLFTQNTPVCSLQYPPPNFWKQRCCGASGGRPGERSVRVPVQGRLRVGGMVGMVG